MILRGMAAATIGLLVVGASSQPSCMQLVFVTATHAPKGKASASFLSIQLRGLAAGNDSTFYVRLPRPFPGQESLWRATGLSRAAHRVWLDKSHFGGGIPVLAGRLKGADLLGNAAGHTSLTG